MLSSASFLDTAPSFLAQLTTFPDGTMLENVLTYSPLQYQLISHLLIIGVSAQAAGFVYFVTSSKRSLSRFQPSSNLSAIVMTSAFLLLLWQLIGWSTSVQFDGTVWGLPFGANGQRLIQSEFSNGYRYLNWSIDVPCLLVQMLYVFDLTPPKFRSLRTKFIAAGILMIYTGYFGQYFELSNNFWFLTWGAISTVFFIYILYLVGNLLFRGRENFPHQAYKAMGTTWWLILISWTLYPLAYLVPLGWQFIPEWGGWAGVTRQFLFMVADVFSKVIFGILLSAVTQIRSAAEGYEPAIQVQPEGGAASREHSEHW
jgi:bacteriorhodopsin